MDKKSCPKTVLHFPEKFASRPRLFANRAAASLSQEAELIMDVVRASFHDFVFVELARTLELSS